MAKDTPKNKKRSVFLRGALVFFILFLIYITVLIYFIIINTNSPQGISAIIPGGMTVDLVILFIAPIALQVIFVFLSMLFTPLFILLARAMKLGKWPMGLKRLDRKYTLGEFVSRGFYLTILSIGLSISINNLLFNVGVEFIKDSIPLSSAAISLILSPISILLLFPAWFLEDSGIIFMKNDNLIELSNGRILTNSLDVRGVGNYFVSTIKGFAGITTPILYIWLFISWDVFQTTFELGLILIFEPIFLIGSFFFSFWIYIKFAPKIKRWLLKKNKYPEIHVKIEN
ncbi:MAG: hypothetical protein ACTSRE_09575 [Promethearchaeota archaeon]